MKLKSGCGNKRGEIAAYTPRRRTEGRGVATERREQNSEAERRTATEKAAVRGG